MEKKQDTAPDSKVIPMPIDQKSIEEFQRRVKENRDGNVGDIVARR